MTKDELRKLLIKKRKEIIDKKELSTRIVNKVLELDIYKEAKVIALYKSMKDEVNTNSLINESLKEKVVLLPRTINNEMYFVIINQDTLYEKSNIGVLEPIGKRYNDKIDLIIVPGIAFDNDLNRIGFGKGYYDKYLSHQDIYKIGICFDEQIVDYIPTLDHDIKMDMIITEKKLIK